jgi:hypothetical protein
MSPTRRFISEHGGVRRRLFRHPGADRHPALAPITRLRELDGVRQQVHQDLPDAGCIAPGRELPRVAGTGTREGDPPVACLRRHESERIVDDGTQPERRAPEPHAFGFQSREIEHLIDDRQQVLATGRRTFDVGPLRIGQRPPDLELEQLVVSEDGVDRRADLVADGRQKFRARRSVGDGRLTSGFGRRGRRRKECIGFAARGEIACYVRKTDQLTRLAPQSRDGDAAPELRAVASNATPFAGVLSPLDGGVEVLLGRSVLTAAIGIEQSQVRALGLILHPALERSCAFTPEGDPALGVEEENGIIPHVVGEQSKCTTRRTCSTFTRITGLSARTRPLVSAASGLSSLSALRCDCVLLDSRGGARGSRGSASGL